MVRLDCQTRFRIHEPFEEYPSASCPHAIPFPQRTPPAICAEILRLLDSFGDDSLGAANPLVDSFLRRRFPDQPCTRSLTRLHLSLANRAHIATYINEAKKKRLSSKTDIGLLQSNSLVSEAVDYGKPEHHAPKVVAKHSG
ncbi:hypothetical protein M413DRAFT_440660 [Hebeloma cylindrosporum]|uniref:Uncharacterized protein n=1 Tax=Hebeloma cylindrosporum TaxID=76867 RepID=A0A0C3CEF6_HEBCY|nr:hypothetical protein M413DRAFT_440660 [Hebeloma cylindrosporum h7]